MLGLTLKEYHDKYLTHCNVVALCRKLGIDRRTYVNWCTEKLGKRKTEDLKILSEFSSPRTELTLKEEKSE